MCGIFGIVDYGKNTQSKYNAVISATNELFIESQARGTDASGICLATDNNVFMFKDAVPAKKFTTTTKYSSILTQIKQDTPFRVIMGHTRAQTKGDNRFNVNNHPIKSGNVVGVHNGVISNDDALFKKFEDKISRIGQVDSEIIFQLIDHFLKNGKTIVDTVKEVVSMVFGSMRCAFINTKNTRYFTLFADYDLPVWIFGYINCIVFASTTEILNKALTRTGGVLTPQYRTAALNVGGGLARINTHTGKIYQEKLDRFGSTNTVVGHKNVIGCTNCDLVDSKCHNNPALCWYHMV